MKRFLGLACLALLLTMTSARAAEVTGKLAGAVSDSEGAALPGVTVTIQSPSLIGGARALVTEATGEFSFAAVPPGVYTIQFELDGFAPQGREQVEVRLDRTTFLNVSLSDSTVTEEIVVTADTPVVDPERVSTSQNFDTEYLENVAVGAANRGYQDVLFQAPGVGAARGSGSNPSVFGSNYQENAFYVDGSNTTDPVTETFGTNFTFDAIQEISFQTGGFEAQYGNATGGVVNVITKSGGNEFSGTLDWRFADEGFATEGDHFDPDSRVFDFNDAAGTLGGPILRDRAWFFASYEKPVTDIEAAGNLTSRKFDGQYYLGKLTLQATPSWTLQAQYSADPADITNAAAPNRQYSPEAQALQEQGGNIVQVYGTGVLPHNLLLDVRATRNRQELDTTPVSGDIERPSFQHVNTGLFTQNYNNAQFSSRDRDEYRASLTWFNAELAGSHEFKGGAELSELEFTSSNFITGDYAYTTRLVNGQVIPRNFTFNEDRSTSTADGSVSTAYLQDSWRPNNRLTLKLGARWDQAEWKNNLGTKVATLEKLQPRLGLAYDLTGDSKTIVRANWGQFMHPASTRLGSIARVTGNFPTIQAFSCEYLRQFTFGLPAGSGVPCEDVAAALHEAQGWEGSIIQDRLGLDADGWVVFSIVGAGEPSLIDPDLDATYAEEAIVSIERQILDKTSVELSYIDKTTENIYEDTCINNIPNRDDDPSGCTTFIVANMPELRREYQGAILKVESRAVDWLRVLGSVTWSESKGSVEATQYAGGDFDVFPTDFVNTFGYLSDDREWRFKVNGYATLPLGFQVGVGLLYESAFPYNTRDRTSPGNTAEFVEPRGNRRANSLSQLDLQLTKGFRVGQVNLQLIGSVYNVLDSEDPVAVCEDINGCAVTGGTADLGEATAWQQPLNYEAGIRITF